MKTLHESEVFVVDCQTTGASPAHGSLLEIGWCNAGPEHPLPVASTLVKLPDGASVPPMITRITGLDDDALEAAIAPEDAWRRLRGAARGSAFTVIHFARFELAFLRDLHSRLDTPDAFPLNVVCSHEIAVRLLPDLPRRGLRALAGYYGLGVDMERRAASHAAATAFVWRHLVADLASSGVTTIAELRAWLALASPPRSRKKVYPMPRSTRLALPDSPGVYRMRRGNGDLLYVGKATSLRTRVNSYFQKQSSSADRTLEMLTQARDVDVTITETAVEAALLESDEIKALKPPYNVALVEGHWTLSYCNRHLRPIEPGSGRCMGPFRHADDVFGLGLLADALSGSRDPARLVELFAHRDPGPDVPVVTSGLALFATERLPARDSSSTARATRQLLRLGAQLWRARLVAAAAPIDEDEDEDDEPGTEDEPEDTWDASRVAGSLSSMVRRGTHALRRAAWLTAITESSIGWADLNHAENRWRALDVTAGEITARRWSHRWHGARLPPHAHTRPTALRHQCLSPATYDRMRVLTTELRRLVDASEHVEVCFGRQQRWRGPRLARVLQWV